MKLTTTMNELRKNSRCTHRILFDAKAKDLHLTEGRNQVVSTAGVTIRTLYNILDGTIDYKDENAVLEDLLKNFKALKEQADKEADAQETEKTEDLFTEAMKAAGYTSKKQFREVLRRAVMKLNRIDKYVDERLTTASGAKVKPLFPKKQTIAISSELEVETRPDIMLESMVEVEKADPEDPKKVNKISMPQIEVIKFRTGRPTFTQKDVDNGQDTTEMYALLCYARAVVDAAGTPDQDVHLVASEYFLGRNDDRVPAMKENETEEETEERLKKQVFLPFDATSGGNMLSLMETYHREGTRAHEESKIDSIYQPVIKEWVSGISSDDCSKEDCEHCQIMDMCKFTASPKRIEKEPTVKSVSDINLTKSQEEIVNFSKGIGVANSGAGVGKTLVVVLNFIMLLLAGADPEKLMLVTFTNNATNEMRSRMKKLGAAFGILPEVIDKVLICTFNAFGQLILEKEYKRFGFTKVPKPIDDEERSIIIEKIITANPIDGLDYYNLKSNMRYVKGALAIVKEIFAIVKQNRFTVAQADVEKVKDILKDKGLYYRFITDDDAVRKAVALYDEYDKTLKEQNLIEYADQEVLVQEILKEDPFYLNQFGLEHVIVDEFQDSNAWQIELLKYLIASPSFISLLMVGDDSQAIYGFRDTTPYFITHIDEVLGKPVQHMFMLENFRCTPEVIDFANKINAMNEDRVVKDLVATRPSGQPVFVKGFYTDDEKYDFVLDVFKKHIAAGFAPEDIMVEARTKYPLMKVADLLAKNGIPSVMLNPELMVENSRVRAAVALCNALENGQDTKDRLVFANARLRMTGSESIYEKSTEFVKETLADLEEEIQAILDAPFENKKDLLMAMLRSIDTDDEVYENFLDTLDFKQYKKIIEYAVNLYEYGALNSYRRLSDYPGAVLSTIHSAKGLEAPVCIVLLDGLDSPDLYRGNGSHERFEETNRMLFVAATRARDELYVISDYVAYGKKGDYHYNKFLQESYEALGMNFDIGTIEAQRELILKQKKAKEIAKAKEQEKLAEIGAHKAVKKATRKATRSRKTVSEAAAELPKAV